MEPIIAGAFGVLLGIVGLWAVFIVLRNHEALNSWPTTKGKVIERGTHQTLNTPALRHAALVKYVYQVDGKEFVSDCIHPKRIQLPEYSTKKWAQKRAESFADEVVVHYNPEDLSESFLVQTSKVKLYIFMGVMCFSILLGAMFLLTKFISP